ncbi:MAG: M81 family metallopeptidase [Alphaproteobacteria bacterium]
MRILIAGFQHETNTFAPTPTRYDDFVRGGAFPAMAHGADVLAMRDVNIPIGGFIRAMRGHALIPVLWAGATPAAHVEEDAFERIAGPIIAAARDQDFDAIYLDLHGAMVCRHDDDGEGRLLAALRTVVGPRIPIVASLDLHANVTAKMLQTADALVAYRTYPHEDMAEAGERAAGLLNILMQRGEKLAQAARRLPFLIPINGMCTLMEPARGVYHALAGAEQMDNLHMSFAPGFPAADFSECGGVVWGYGADAARITGAVDALAGGIVAREGDWVVPLLAPHDAVRQAMRIAATASRPVVIADTQDNPGGGGDSNTTGMLRALVECGAEGAALGLMVDPDAAFAAHQAGTGRDISIALGGQSGGDAPLAATFRVEQLSDGRCIYGGPMMHGKQTDVGPTARLSLGGVQVVVSSHKDQMLDRNLYRMAGVEPERMQILVNKSSVHFRADFQPIAEAVLVAKAPGPLLADPADFPWRHLAKGMRLRPLGPAFTGQPSNSTT